MNLPELLSTGPDIATLKGLALVLTPQLQAVLSVVQETLPEDRQFRVQPRPLVDGRFLLCADLLTEIGPNGLYHEGFGQLPAEMLSLVEVLPLADAAALLPIENEM